MKLKILLSIPLWVLMFFLVLVPSIILGWILIPIAILFKAYEGGESNLFWEVPGVQKKKIMVWKWGFMWPWGNEEDGLLCGEELIGKPNWLRILYWTAFRNPANNFRFIKYISVIPNGKVTFYGSHGTGILAAGEYDRSDIAPREEWYFCHQGIYSNFFIHFHLFGQIRRFWIGWKIYPSDLIREEFGYRNPGAGFTLQPGKRVRK